MTAHAASLRRPHAPEPRAELPPWPHVPELPIAPLPQRARRGRRRVVLACVTLVLLSVGAAVAWTWLARPDTPRPAVPIDEREVTLGAATVTVPLGWASARAKDARIPDLGAEEAVFTPVPGLSASAVVVFAPGRFPAPLRHLIGPLGQGRRTTLAGWPARAYEPRPVEGGRIAELTVATTLSGNLAVVCIAPEASWAGASGCAAKVAPAR
jgi:hypothetical protein